MKKNDKPCSRCAKMRSALQIISTWATFEYENLPRGHALVASEVEALCRRVLDETNEEDKP